MALPKYLLHEGHLQLNKENITAATIMANANICNILGNPPLETPIFLSDQTKNSIGKIMKGITIN